MWVNEHDRRVREVRLSGVDSVTLRQPLDETIERIDSIGNDPEHDVNGAARVTNIEGANAELRRTPVPPPRCSTKKGAVPVIRVLGKEDGQIEIPDASLTTDVVVCSALCQRYEPLPLLPCSPDGVSLKERRDLNRSEPL